MRYLREDTSHTVRVGPFVDEDDGKTAETALTISQADIRLSKNGGDFAQSNDSGGATHDEFGWYYLTLDATDCNTAGHLQLAIHESGALPVFVDYTILPQQVYDSLVAGTDALQVHANEITNNLITAAAIATGAIAADEIAAAAANKIADHIWRRTFQNACDSSDGDTKTGRSGLGLMAKAVNKVAPNGSNLETFEDDDTTVLLTQAVTTNPAADPITALDTT